MAGRRTTPIAAERAEAHLCTLPRRLHVLSHNPFFRGLTAAQITEISRFFREKAFRAGESVYFAGDKAERLYIVATGKVKLVRDTPLGKSVLLDILTGGDFFGSLSALGDQAYPDTAVAHTDCCVLAITAQDFARLLERYPAVAVAALGVVSARLRATREQVEQLSAHSVEQRIAATLLKLAARLGERKGKTTLIQMPLSRQDLAEMTGTTPETVSRTMAQFRHAGLIRTGRRWTAILDSPGLEKIRS